MTTRLWIFGVLALVSVTGMAGGRDGAGDLMQPFTPTVDFVYECQLRLDHIKPGTDVRGRSTGKFTIDRKQMADSWGSIDIPETAWTDHGTFNARDPKWEVTPTKELPKYNLKNHGVGMSFLKSESGLIAVEFHANVIHERFKSGGLARVYAEFESKLLGVQIQAADTRPDHQGESLDLTVTCKRTK